MTHGIPHRGLVLLALDQEAQARTLTEQLSGAGFTVQVALHGAQALEQLRQQRPDVLLVDVGIGEPPAPVLIAQVRNEVAGLKILLLASVYSPHAYRRPPQQLYGADDFINPLDLEAQLVGKLANLQAQQEGGRAAASAQLRQQALAFSIAADIVVHHQAEVASVLDGGTPSPALSAALEDGRRLWREMCQDGAAGPDNCVQVAFAHLLARAQARI